MKKRILFNTMLAVIIMIPLGCLQFFADKKKKCEVKVEYIYHLNQGSPVSGTFSLAQYPSGFSFTNVPVDKTIVSSDCPNYDPGTYQDVAVVIAYSASSKELQIRLADKVVENAPTAINFIETYIAGNFETGAATIGSGDTVQNIYCLFDFANNLIRLNATKQLEYTINYKD